jgi:hypothetical protein
MPDTQGRVAITAVFAVMLVLSFISMYVLMYAMVDRLSNVLPNLNQLYMAGLMVAPMAVIELLLMRSMFPDRRKNAITLVVAVLGFVVFWLAIRMQIGIGDRQFLKSMVPHHAGAVLICERLKGDDPQIRRLCNEIVASQKSEIALMKSMLVGEGGARTEAASSD